MNWNIERQELVLFHARHKRLRFMQENHDSGTENEFNRGFIRYRKHAQQILFTLGDILRDSLNGSEIKVLDVDADRTARPISIPSVLPQGLSLDALDAYLKYCERVMADEGWEADSPHREILTKLRKGECSTATCLSGCSIQTPSYSAVQHLIASLPFLPHWDLPGQFSDKSNRSHTILGGMKALHTPLYATRLIYPRETSSDRKSLSKGLLGYPVQLEIHYSDAIGDTAQVIRAPRDDFYKYCHFPTTRERALYQAYAVVVDSLQKALIPESGDSLFYIAYPIKTPLGRTHFWHFYVAPHDHDATLEDLWSSWWRLRQRLDWPHLHASLGAELDQLDIGYAQAAMGAAISGSKVSKQDADKLVCEHAHMLFPVSCCCFSSGEVREGRWGYQPYTLANVADEQIKADLQQLGSLGHVWNELPSDHVCRDDCPSVNSKIKFNSKRAIGKGVSASLSKQRYCSIVEQQQFLVKEMMDAGKAREKEEEIKWENWKASCRHRFRELTNDQRHDLRCSIQLVSSLEAPTPDIPVPSGTMHWSAFVRRWYRLTEDVANRTKDISDVKHEMMLVVSGNAHTMVSEFLELNPIKMLTHVGDHYKEGWSDKRALATVRAFLPLIDKLPIHFSDPYKRELSTFAQMAMQVFAQNIARQSSPPQTEFDFRLARSKLQVHLGTIQHQFNENAEILYHSHDDPRLSLPGDYANAIFSQALAISTFNGIKPSLAVFRLRVAVSDMYRGYCVFAWNGGKSIGGETQGEDTKRDLAALCNTLEGIGKCFVGKGNRSEVTWYNVGADGTTMVPVANRANEIGLDGIDDKVKTLLASNKSILLLVFETYYKD